jgi:hypothetical protein
MPTTVSMSRAAGGSARRAILLAWLLAGTLDISTAVACYPLTANASLPLSRGADSAMPGE